MGLFDLAKKRRAKRKKSPKARKKSNQIPLRVLERRVRRLNAVIKKRGGKGI